jgi:hypothetical protein
MTSPIPQPSTPFTRLSPVRGPPPGAPAAAQGITPAEEKVDRWMPITILGAPLTLHIKGNLGAGHLLDGDPSRLDQTCLALEALMLSALAHDPQIRSAAQRIRDAHPQFTDAQVMSHLFPYLEFTATSVSIYRPIPEMRAGAAADFEPHHWQPDEDLEIGTPGPRDFSSLGQQDALLCGYRALLQHHAGGRAPGHTPSQDLIRIWNTFQERDGAKFPFEDRKARNILRRLFEDFRRAAERSAGPEPVLSIVPHDEDPAITVSPATPTATLTFAAPAKATLTFQPEPETPPSHAAARATVSFGPPQSGGGGL